MNLLKEPNSILANAPDVDWREEKKRMWRSAYPILGFIAFIFIVFLTANYDRAAWIAGIGFIAVFLIMRSEIEGVIRILKYGKKYLAKILDETSTVMLTQGKVEIYFDETRSIRASYKRPAARKEYSEKNYAWPEIGDVVAVYYWDGKPAHTYLICEQFRKIGIS